MSIASISYSSITDAKGEAKQLSRKLDTYADHLNDHVYKKLNSYNGQWTGNLSNAKSKIGSKISDLRSASSKYSNYASDLDDLKKECQNTDKAVKSRISTLTASFKKAHGIRNSHIENGLYYLGVGIGNSTAAGRWVNDKIDKGKEGLTYVKDRLKAWYNYEGGKELIKGVIIGVLEIAVAVVSIVGAIVSGGALLVIIASVVAGVIAIANGVMNIYNESKAYNATQNGDPAMGRRYSDEDTIQDTLRKESDDKFWHNVATGIDIVNIACTVVTVVSSAGKLVKNGYKWATGSTSDLKDIKLKDVFSKGALKEFGSKLKTTFKNGFSDIAKAFKSGNWTNIKMGAADFWSDFKFNLSERFNNFDSFKDGTKSVKNYLSLFKDLAKDGITGTVIIENIVLPSISIGEITTIKTGEGGQMYFDFDSIKLDDIYSIGDKTIGLFKNDSSMTSDVIDKLSSISNINISVPDIHIPEVNITGLAA